MLEVQDLGLWRGATRLFTGLSFSVDTGNALLLRGPNGTGKTSLLRVLAGLTRPEGGSIRWQGAVQPDGMCALAAYSGHTSALSTDLTIEQNLVFHARLTGWSGEVNSLLKAVGLAAVADLEVRFLSAGQRRRGGLARLLMSSRPLWLLDEPFTNLDADGRQLVEACIGAHLAAGRVAVIAAHDDMLSGSARVSTLRMGGS